jgi:hypothetical protein
MSSSARKSGCFVPSHPAPVLTYAQCEHLLEIRCRQLTSLIAAANARILEFEKSALLTLWDDALKLLPETLLHTRLAYEKVRLDHLGRAFVDAQRTNHYARVAEACVALTSLHNVLHHVQTTKLTSSTGSMKTCSDATAFALATRKRFNADYFALPKLVVQKEDMLLVTISTIPSS